MSPFSLRTTRARISAFFGRRGEDKGEPLLKGPKNDWKSTTYVALNKGEKNRSSDAWGLDELLSDRVSTSKQTPSRDKQIAWHVRLIDRYRYDLVELEGQYGRSYVRLDPSLHTLGLKGYLSDDVETLEDLQLPQFGSELVAFLELKTKWSILRQQLKVALCELFLLEHDPAFDLEAFHTWAELREQCARIWAMVPGCKRWYEH